MLTQTLRCRLVEVVLGPALLRSRRFRFCNGAKPVRKVDTSSMKSKPKILAKISLVKELDPLIDVVSFSNHDFHRQ
jgi:hypothetical protein